jgi:hypothetical protein
MSMMFLRRCDATSVALARKNGLKSRAGRKQFLRFVYPAASLYKIFRPFWLTFTASKQDL